METSRFTVSASWRRPVRASSALAKDCTPRLTRLMPARLQIAIFSPVKEPGAASMVASCQGRPGNAERILSNGSHSMGTRCSAAQKYCLWSLISIRSARTPRAARRCIAFPVPSGKRLTRSYSKCTSERKTARKYRCQPTFTLALAASAAPRIIAIRCPETDRARGQARQSYGRPRCASASRNRSRGEPRPLVQPRRLVPQPQLHGRSPRASRCDCL